MKKVKLLGILLLSGIFLSSCSSNNSKVSELEKENETLKSQVSSLKTQLGSEEQKNENEETEETSDTSKSKTVPINESISFTVNNKEALSLKVTDVTTNQSAFPDYMISLDDYDVTKMIAVTIEYTNIAYGDAYLPHVQYFQAYTKDGKALTRENAQDGQDPVAEGRSGTTKIFFVAPDNSSNLNQIELDFISNDNSTKLCTFDLSVSH